MLHHQAEEVRQREEILTVKSAAAILKRCFKDKEKRAIPSAEPGDDVLGFSYWLVPNGDFHYMGDEKFHYDIRKCLVKGKDYGPDDVGVMTFPRFFERLTGAVKVDAFPEHIEYEVSMAKSPTGKQEKAMKDMCEIKGSCRISILRNKDDYCLNNERTDPKDIRRKIEYCRV